MRNSNRKNLFDNFNEQLDLMAPLKKAAESILLSVTVIGGISFFALFLFRLLK
jgi:hypothetical protein